MISVTPEQVMNMDIQQLWNSFRLLMEEEDDRGKKLSMLYKEDLLKIKWGSGNVDVPIWYFINEWYEIYPSSGRVKILGHGKFPLKDIMEEKDKREAIMRSILIENTDNDSLTEVR